jgi:hypothetical protein
LAVVLVPPFLVFFLARFFRTLHVSCNFDSGMDRCIQDRSLEPGARCPSTGDGMGMGMGMRMRMRMRMWWEGLSPQKSERRAGEVMLVLVLDEIGAVWTEGGWIDKPTQAIRCYCEVVSAEKSLAGPVESSPGWIAGLLTPEASAGETSPDRTRATPVGVSRAGTAFKHPDPQRAAVSAEPGGSGFLGPPGLFAWRRPAEEAKDLCAQSISCPLL